ncbi:MAG: hypothetical protein QXO67_01615 [Candidatus Bathyarchaeia archaeon]
MPGIDEGPTTFRYRVQDPEKFDKFRVKEITTGIKITLGRVKGTDRWEIQNYIFDKERFKTREQVQKWLEQHLKSEIQLLLDFKAWNEYRKRLLQAYLQISKIT